MPHEQLAPFATDLVVLRRLLNEGEEAIARGDDVSVRVGLLQVDLAAAMLMKAGLRFYGERPDPRCDLSKLIQAVNVAAKREVVDDTNALLTLRKMRNTAMHAGIP